MAGVADTAMDYHWDFENGERFTLTVQVSPNAADEQAADIASFLRQGVATKKLNSHQTDLGLRLPIDPPPPKNNNRTDYPAAGFHFGRNDTADNPTADVNYPKFCSDLHGTYRCKHSIMLCGSRIQI